jgi:hypothetical protein
MIIRIGLLTSIGWQSRRAARADVSAFVVPAMSQSECRRLLQEDVVATSMQAWRPVSPPG